VFDLLRFRNYATHNTFFINLPGNDPLQDQGYQTQ